MSEGDPSGHTPHEHILVVDDEAPVRLAIRGYLEGGEYRVEEAASLAEARRALADIRFDAMILDYRLPDGDSLELLREVQAEDPALPVILLTGHGSIELAVQAMKEGAEHFLTKPTDMEALEEVLERSLEIRRLRRTALLAETRKERDVVNPFAGSSRAIAALEREARLALRTDSPVLIEGETGAGKGVLARWLHRQGRRSEEPFVDLNCAGLPANLLESELFGHKRGAFTGAVAEKKGLLEAADRGVLFLDEIGDTEAAIQAKLLKVVEEKRFRKLGSVQDQRVDVQMIAATNRDLRRMAEEGEFRADLYFRISTLVLEVPPLRERPEDLPLLARGLLETLARERGSEGLLISPEALQRLQAYRWPGNIRELRNVLERAMLLCEEGVVEPRHLRLEGAGGEAGDAEEKGTLDQAERREIERALTATGGVVSEAADRLGISRSTLYNKLKEYGLTLDDYRS